MMRDTGMFELEDPLLFEQPPEERPNWIGWQPSPNHNTRRGKTVTAIIYHLTAGPSLEGTVSGFKNSKSGRSAHFVIGKDGSIVQMVSLDRASWHAGKSALAGKKNVNDFSIGIEIVNWGQLSSQGGKFYNWTKKPYIGPRPVLARGVYWEPYTNAQYNALIRLTQYLLTRFPTITHITGHEHVALPAGRKNDPGGAFDWNRISSILKPAFRGHIGPLSVGASTRELELFEFGTQPGVSEYSMEEEYLYAEDPLEAYLEFEDEYEMTGNYEGGTGTGTIPAGPFQVLSACQRQVYNDVPDLLFYLDALGAQLHQSPSHPSRIRGILSGLTTVVNRIADELNRGVYAQGACTKRELRSLLLRVNRLKWSLSPQTVRMRATLVNSIRRAIARAPGP